MDKNKKKGWILNLLIVFAAAVMIYGVWNMISLQKQYKDAKEEYQEVQKIAQMEDAKEETKEEDAAEENLPEVDLAALKKENPDTVGWLYYPVLGINYPIMQDKDNTYYIKHTF